MANVSISLFGDLMRLPYGPAPAATYVYRLRYRLLDGREEVLSGEVLLVR